MGWGILNREAEYIADFRRSSIVPVFAVTPDQEEVGRIQGQQLASFSTESNVLYIEGPTTSSAASLRPRGMLATKPSTIEMKVLKGDWTRQGGHKAVTSWLSRPPRLSSNSSGCLSERCNGHGGARHFASLSEPAREQ
jgi:ABC-type sugar transport system substrate-binding protein